LDLLERKPEQRLRPEATDTREQEHGKERDPDSRGARDGVGLLPHGICNSDDIFCCRLYLVNGQLGMKLEFSRTGRVNPLHAQGLENQLASVTGTTRTDLGMEELEVKKRKPGWERGARPARP
jgi:hypothetical protein